MVYAGYAPAKLPTELSALQRALKDVTNMDSLDILAKLVYNAACMPHEDKYKKVKMTNSKIKDLVVDAPGALAVMHALGWEESEDELVCRKNMSMAMFRDIEEAKTNLKKDQRKEMVAQLKAGA